MTRALVTGAATRLGRAMALELARQGHDVALHYARSQSDAEAVRDQIRSLGRHCEVLAADLLDPEAARTLVPRAADALGGPLTVLINNASIFEPDSLTGLTPESWSRAFETNLHAPAILTGAFATQAPAPLCTPDAEPVAQALVVNMIDQRVRRPRPDFLSYTLAKSGLRTLTELAAQALAPAVRVNGIAPGPTLRSIHQSDADFARERHGTLLQRGAHPADILHALRYLLDAPAVTGQILYVDGGQSLVSR